MNSLLKLLLLLLVIAVSNAQGQVQYELPDGTVLDGVMSLKGTLPNGAITILGLTLGRGTFTDVRNILGATTNLPRTEDPHEADSICYVAHNDPSVRLLFTSGWPEKPVVTLTSFLLTTSKLPHTKSPCSSSTKLTVKLATGNGLGLGLPQSKLKSMVLGKPSKDTPDWIVYSFEKYRKYSKAERERGPRAPGGGEYKGEYIYNSLLAHFTHGKTDLLRVWVGQERSGDQDLAAGRAVHAR